MMMWLRLIFLMGISLGMSPFSYAAKSNCGTAVENIASRRTKEVAFRTRLKAAQEEVKNHNGNFWPDRHKTIQELYRIGSSTTDIKILKASILGLGEILLPESNQTNKGLYPATLSNQKILEERKQALRADPDLKISEGALASFQNYREFVERQTNDLNKVNDFLDKLIEIWQSRTNSRSTKPDAFTKRLDAIKNVLDTLHLAEEVEAFDPEI